MRTKFYKGLLWQLLLFLYLIQNKQMKFVEISITPFYYLE